MLCLQNKEEEQALKIKDKINEAQLSNWKPAPPSENQVKRKYPSKTAAEKDESDRARYMEVQQYGSDKGFSQSVNAALINKENKMLIQFKKQKVKEEKEYNRRADEDMTRFSIEAGKQGEEKACLQIRKRRDVAYYNLEQIRQKKQLKQMAEELKRKEGDYVTRLKKEYEEEIGARALQNAEYKKRATTERLEEISKQNLGKNKTAEGLYMDEYRKQIQREMDRKFQLGKKYQAERIRQQQLRSEKAVDNLAAIKKKQAELMALEQSNMGEGLDELKAKEAKQRKENKEKTAEMFKSIAESRNAMIRRKEEEKLTEQKNNWEWREQQIQTEYLCNIKQKEKDQEKRQKRIGVNDVNFAMMAKKQAFAEQLRREERMTEAKIAEQASEMERRRHQHLHGELLKAVGLLDIPQDESDEDEVSDDQQTGGPLFEHCMLHCPLLHPELNITPVPMEAKESSSLPQPREPAQQNFAQREYVGCIDYKMSTNTHQPTNVVLPPICTSRQQPTKTVHPRVFASRKEPTKTVLPRMFASRKQPTKTVHPRVFASRKEPTKTVLSPVSTSRKEPTKTVLPPVSTSREQPTKTVLSPVSTSREQPTKTVLPPVSTSREQPTKTVLPPVSTSIEQPTKTVLPPVSTSIEQPTKTVLPPVSTDQKQCTDTDTKASQQPSKEHSQTLTETQSIDSDDEDMRFNFHRRRTDITKF
ncbi:cilia- and flagella- associated protein 210-like [Brachyistius frenatus]|uniref:cilia- and flagella- associated protein 210-like n=1 Tax=Brachyistius frenatus TaxID=100188 RepID=UPI0037E8B354